MSDLTIEDHGDEGGSRTGIEAALADLRRGRMVLVLDDEDRENEGDLIMAAEFATRQTLGFLIRHTSGIVCVALEEDRAQRLDLPRMVERSDDPRGTAFTVSVDLKHSTTTGVSAADRARTIRALAEDTTAAEQFSRPGHVFPLVARPGGVLVRPGHTESAVDLCKLAGLSPVGVLAEVTNDDGTMARRDDLAAFAAEHDLVTITVAALAEHLRATTPRIAPTPLERVRRVAEGRIPTAHGEFRAVTYVDGGGAREHLALVLGQVAQQAGDTEPVLVRVHSECLTGDVFGSQRCDCGEQLEQAMNRIGAAGRGAVVYLRGHEGRGIGLSSKLRAYVLQDAGLDTVDANTAQGLPADGRDYGAAAAILEDLGVRWVALLTNNPAKIDDLTGHGVHIVRRLPVVTTPNPQNIRYLTTKARRMNHDMSTTSVLCQGEVS